jgi:hypothetical protein
MNTSNTQDSPSRLTVRMPGYLHQELQESAALNGRTVNAEVLARLQAPQVSDQLAAQAGDIAELKRMVRELLLK